MGIDNLKKFSDKIHSELKMLISDAPEDNVDWALLMYLYENSVPLRAKFYDQKIHILSTNIITIGKLSRYFGLGYSEVHDRLKRMFMWCSMGPVYGEYIKPVYICNITEMGIDTIVILKELIDMR